MIEILRKIPQNNFDLLLFLLLILISVLLYNRDGKRFLYYYRSFYNKQFEISYGRHLRLTHNFIVLLSVQSILVVSHLLARYLEYCSNYLNNTHLFALSFVGVLGYLTVKWVSLYGVSVLFKNERAFHLFSTKSAKTANLFLAPFAVLCLFVYLNYGYGIETVTKLMYVLLSISLFAKLSTYKYMRNEKLMDVFYFILYLCIFEIVPILWILIGLDC